MSKLGSQIFLYMKIFQNYKTLKVFLFLNTLGGGHLKGGGGMKGRDARG